MPPPHPPLSLFVFHVLERVCSQAQFQEEWARIFGDGADPHVFTVDVTAACSADFKGKETVDLVITDPYMIWLQIAYNAKV